jgi:hypothetical protein
VSSSRQATVHRSYQPEPGYMKSAIELLLKKSVSKKAAEPAPKPEGHDATTLVRNTEGVSRVEQRPDRSSEITYPAAL